MFEVLAGSRESYGQLMFQVIPMVLNRVEVRALGRLLKFFHSERSKPCIHRAHFVHRGIVMLEQDCAPLAPAMGNYTTAYIHVK